MIGLRTGRALVVDNDPRDGVAMLSAFSKIRIAATYYSGEFEQKPDDPLTGIRIAALDMNLGADGSAENEAMLSPLLSLLPHIISKDNGPLVFIAWTTHPSLIERFSELLPTVCPAAKPTFIVPLNKSEVKLGNGDFDINKIVSKLEEAASHWSPLEILHFWEQLVHDSASRICHVLSDLAGANDTPSWNPRLKMILRSLGKASMGKQSTDGKKFLRGILETLNPIHYDRLEHFTDDIPTALAAVANLLNTDNAETDVNLSGVESMLLTAPIHNGDKTVYPGNVYMEHKWHPASTSFPAHENRIKKGALIEELCDFQRDHTFSNLWKENKEAPEGSPEKETTKTQLKSRRLELRNDLKNASHPILVDVTPACDFAQQKNPMARLVGGILVQYQYRHLLKQGQGTFMRVLGPFKVDPPNWDGVASGDYCLVLNSRYLFGLLQAEINKSSPSARLRVQVVVDVQSWVASHAARPGILSVSSQ